MSIPTANFRRVCLQKNGTYVVDYVVKNKGKNEIRLILYDTGGVERYTIPITKDGPNRIKIQIEPPMVCYGSTFQIEQYWLGAPNGIPAWIALSTETNMCEKCRPLK